MLYLFNNNNNYYWSVVKNREALETNCLLYNFTLGCGLWMHRLADELLSTWRVLYYRASNSRKVQVHVHNGTNEPISGKLLFFY